jgi:20S proteasome subunit alpha 4
MSIEEALKLSCKSMLDVVESGSKNIELGVITLKEFRMLTDEEVEKLVQNVNK